MDKMIDSKLQTEEQKEIYKHQKQKQEELAKVETKVLNTLEQEAEVIYKKYTKNGINNEYKIYTTYKTFDRYEGWVWSKKAYNARAFEIELNKRHDNTDEGKINKLVIEKIINHKDFKLNEACYAFDNAFEDLLQLTPLIKALKHGKYYVFNLLMTKQDVDINNIDSGLPAIYYAADLENSRYYDLLIASEKIDLSVRPIEANSRTLIELLTDKGHHKQALELIANEKYDINKFNELKLAFSKIYSEFDVQQNLINKLLDSNNIYYITYLTMVKDFIQNIKNEEICRNNNYHTLDARTLVDSSEVKEFKYQIANKIINKPSREEISQLTNEQSEELCVIEEYAENYINTKTIQILNSAKNKLDEEALKILISEGKFNFAQQIDGSAKNIFSFYEDNKKSDIYKFLLSEFAKWLPNTTSSEFFLPKYKLAFKIIKEKTEYDDESTIKVLEVIEKYIEKKADISLLLQVSEYSLPEYDEEDIELIKYLINSGNCDFSQKDNDGDNIFYYLDDPESEIFKLLIQNGAQSDLNAIEEKTLDYKILDYKICTHNLWYYATQNIDEETKNKIQNKNQLAAFEKQKIVKASFEILLSKEPEKYKNIIFDDLDNYGNCEWGKINFQQDDKKSNNFYEVIKENPMLVNNIHYGNNKVNDCEPFFNNDNVANYNLGGALNWNAYCE